MRKISKANMLVFITAAIFFVTPYLLFLIRWFLPVRIPEVFTMILGQMIVFVPTLIYALVKKISIPKMVRMKKTKPVNFLMAVLIMLCAYPVIVFLNLVSMLFVENAVSDIMINMVSGSGVLVTMFVVAIMPGFGEELLFRGVLYNTYSKTAPLAGLFISACAFGMMHGNFNQMPYAIFIGLIFVLMMEATDSIWITMFMHFLMNGSNVLMLSLMNPETLSAQMAASTSIQDLFRTMAQEGGIILVMIVLMIYFVIALVFGAAAFGLIVLTFKINNRSIRACFRAKPMLGEKNRIFDFWQLAFLLLIVTEFILGIVL